MPADLLEVTKSFMQNPKKILVKTKELTLEGIRKFYVNTEKEEFKLETLFDQFGQAIIFVKGKQSAGCQAAGWLSG